MKIRDTEKRSYKIVYLYEVITIGPGNQFGHQALTNDNEKRNATIIAFSDIHLGVLTKDNYN